LAWANSADKAGSTRRDIHDITYPELGDAYYILDHAMSFGLRHEWHELKAWCDLFFTTLHPFEAEAIIKAGIAYNNAIGEYNGKDVPRPYFDKNAPRTGIRLSERVNND